MKAHCLLWGVVCCVLLMSACSKQVPDDALPMGSEGVMACTAMIKDFGTIDVESADEKTLEAAMNKADDRYDLCQRQYTTAGRTDAERAIYGHRAEEIRVYSLLFEAVLSRRYDDMVGYCPILEDLLTTLAADIRKMEDEFADLSFTDQEQRRMHELHRFDAQSLEILGVQWRMSCRGVTAGELQEESERRKREFNQTLDLSK